MPQSWHRGRAEFLKGQEEEIQRRAQQAFDQLKADFEAKIPELVHQRLLALLREQSLPKEIAAVIQEEAQKAAEHVLRDRSGWPEWFREYYRKEVLAGVRAGLNREFEQRVEASSTTRAQAELLRLKD